MGLTQERKKQLDEMCRKFRVDMIKTVHAVQTGHPGGSLSACEILTALYFEKANVDPKNPRCEDRDRIVISKGHSGPMLYTVMAAKGFFPPEELKTFRQLNSRLQGHPNPLDCPGVEMTSGPLGIAIGASVGLAAALRLSKSPARVYALMGDGESNEGVVWEACQAANKFKLDNLTFIMDKNGVQLDGPTDEIMPGLDMAKKFSAFGLNVIECDGHDIAAVCDAIDKAKATKGVTSSIIAHTVKGKGVSFMEGKSAWHGKNVNDQERDQALKELGA